MGQLDHYNSQNVTLLTLDIFQDLNKAIENSGFPTDVMLENLDTVVPIMFM